MKSSEDILLKFKKVVLGELEDGTTYYLGQDSEREFNECVAIAKEYASQSQSSVLPSEERIVNDIYEIIETRISYFKEKYHKYEAIQLNEALQVIKNLMPPDNFEPIKSQLKQGYPKQQLPSDEEMNKKAIAYGVQKSQHRFGITDYERSEAEIDFLRGYNAAVIDFRDKLNNKEK